MDLGVSVGLVQRVDRLSIAPPVAPAALGLLPDLSVISGDTLGIRLADDFTGPDLTFALAPGSDPLPTGLTLSADGWLTGSTTGESGPHGIVIRAANAHGYADSAFALTVTMPLAFTASLSGLSANVIHGPSAMTGVTLSAVADGFGDETPQTILYQWKTVESGAIPGATSATYTPDAAIHDGETLFCTITPDGHGPQDTEVAVIRQVPPVAAGALQPLVWGVDEGPVTVPTAQDFTGDALVYTVVGPGCSVDAVTGEVTVQSESPVITTVAVTVTNTGGSATSTFELTIEAPEVGPGPDISAPLLDDAADTISFTLSTAATVYWRRDPAGTNADAAMVLAGGGYDSGSFLVSEGANQMPVTFATGNDGPQEISFVAAEIPEEPSEVRTVPINIDTVAPVLTGATTASVTATGSSGDITTDEAGGTLHAGIWPAAAAPDLAALEAGTGAVWHASQPAASGTTRFDAAGLTPETSYRWHFLQRDAAGNLSNAATSDLTTQPAGNSG